jgi:nitroreductase
MHNIDVSQYRKAGFNVSPAFVNRWSPRAMSGEEMSEEELLTLFEAARWAPSSYNNQPWRFFCARRNTESWQEFFDLLVERNQRWCRNAAALIVVASKKTLDHNEKPSRTHSYDAGAAWMSLALQGSMMGLVVHGMQGFSYEKAAEVLNLPWYLEVEAMAAVGKPGSLADLPEEFHAGEVPNGRKELSETVFEGGWKEQ